MITNRHSMLSQTESTQWIRSNIPIAKKKKHTQTHTTAFYPIGSVKSPHSGPHSCCYGMKAGLGGGRGGGEREREDRRRRRGRRKGNKVKKKTKGGGQGAALPKSSAAMTFDGVLPQLCDNG